MSPKYKRMSNRQAWNDQDMQAAINAVTDGEMGWLRAAKMFSVPQATLRRRVQNKNKISKGASRGYLGGSTVVFDKQLEKEIIEHIQCFESRFFGLSTLDVRKLAFQLAIANHLPNKFNQQKKEAGWSWLKAFRERNPEISLRIPESTSVARARAFNRPQVSSFFNKLKGTLEDINFHPANLWNMDESGLTTVPSKNQKIFATRGRKQVGVLTSAERGQHVTTICCMSAIGCFVPPAFIFPRKYLKNELMDDSPNGSIAFAQENGWTSSEIFLKWLKHFVNHIKPSKEEKVVLLVDGHSSHKSLEAQIYAKDNGIVLFCFPPHTTHRLQPLDVSFFGPLTTYYNQELNSWLKTHPGRVVTQFQIAKIFRIAYSKSATIQNAEHGFAATGIFPLNPEIFPEHLYSPAEVTNVEENDTQPLLANSAFIDAKAKENIPNNFSKPSTSSVIHTNKRSSSHVSCLDILPLPKATQTVEKRKRKSGSYGVLNSTPEITNLQLAASEKAEKERQKSLRKRMTVIKKVADTCEDSPTDEPYSDNDEEDHACLYCNEMFSKSKRRERWIQCQVGKEWAHTDCAGVDKKIKTYICELCI